MTRKIPIEMLAGQVPTGDEPVATSRLADTGLTDAEKAFPMPFLMPVYYTGNTTLTPSDPWLRVMKRHDGIGTITLANGVYDAGATPITLSGAGDETTIMAQNVGMATVQGRWDLFSGQGLLIDGVNLKPRLNNLLMFTKGTYFELRDIEVDVRGMAHSYDTVFSINSGQCRIVAKNKVTRFRIGPEITVQVFDIDSGSAKILGDPLNPTNFVRMDFEGAVSSTLQGLVFDNSDVLLATYKHYSNNKLGRGVAARRGSQLTIQDDVNRFENLDIGVIGIQGAEGSFEGTVFALCNTGISQSSGARFTIHPTVTFTGMGQYKMKDDSAVNGTPVTTVVA